MPINQPESLASTNNTEIFRQTPDQRRTRVIEMAAKNPQIISAGAESYANQIQAFKDIAPIFFGPVPLSDYPSRIREATNYFDRQPEISALSKKDKSATIKTKVGEIEAKVTVIHEFNSFLKNGNELGVDQLKPASPDKISSTPAEQLTSEYQQRENNVADNLARALGIAQASIQAGDTRMLVETISSYPDIAYHPEISQQINDHLAAAVTNPDQLSSIQNQSQNELLTPYSPAHLPDKRSTFEDIREPQVVETFQNLADLVFISVGHQAEKTIVEDIKAGKTTGFTSPNQEGFRNLINLLNNETGDTSTRDALRLLSLPNETSVNPITIPATLAEFAASSDFQKVDPNTQRKIFCLLAGSLHSLPTSDQGKIAEIMTTIESGSSPLASALVKNIEQKFSQNPDTAAISSIVEANRHQAEKTDTTVTSQSEIINTAEPEVTAPQAETPVSEAPQVSREQALVIANQNKTLELIVSGKELPSTGNLEVDNMLQAAKTMAESLLKNSPPEQKNSVFLGFGNKGSTFSRQQFMDIADKIKSLNTPLPDLESELGRQIQLISLKIANAKMVIHNQTINK